MSLFLILLAAGDSKRLKSNTPKPFQTINNKNLLEHTIYAFRSINQVKKTVIVYNKKHKKKLNKLNLKNCLLVRGGKSRQESTLNKNKENIAINKEGSNVVVVKNIMYLRLVCDPNFLFLLSLKIL